METLTHLKTIEKSTGKETSDDCWKNSDVWSIFENRDAELKRKILEFPALDEFEDWPRTKWKIHSYEGDEVKCVSGKNVKYFNKTDIEERLAHERTEKLGETFDPVKSFFEQFGSVHDVQTHKEKDWFVYTVKTLTGGFLPGHEGGLSRMGCVNEQERTLNCTKNGITLKFHDVGVMSFLEFLPNGDFINREYNIPLQRYTQKAPDFSKMLEMLKKAVKDLGPLEYSEKTKKFYNQSFCYVPSFTKQIAEGRQDPYDMEFELLGIPKRHGKDDYQQYSGDTIFKKPANTVNLTPAQVWKKLEENELKHISEKFKLT